MASNGTSQRSISESGSYEGWNQRSNAFVYPEKGDLQDTPARFIIDQLYRESFSGTLSLHYRDKKKKLWFYNGEVFRIQSNLVPELLGKMMVDRSWINEAELRQCLEIQRDQIQSGTKSKLLGEIVSEIHSIDEDEISALIEQQNLQSYLQALTWNSGSYQFTGLDLKTLQEPLISYKDVLTALRALFEVSASSDLSPLFQRLDDWTPDFNSVELSRTPLWVILAGCRRMGLNGILSVRRQSKLYEIVLKYGVPLTLYEGSFGAPRQTIVVRQASEEHERFFIEELFKLFSFLTGTVYFRRLSDQAEESSVSGSIQNLKEETAVTRSVRSDDIPNELNAELMKSAVFYKKWFFLAKRYCKQFFYRFKKDVFRLYSKSERQVQKLLKKRSS